MSEINLEIVGEARNRVHHLCLAAEKIGIKSTVHELPSDYEGSNIKFYKRHHWRKTLRKQIESVMQERDPSNTVFFASQMPTLNPPVLKSIAGGFPTVMDIRDIWQEHNSHPFIKRKIEQWEQTSTMNAVDVVTYTHSAFFPYLVSDIKDVRKLKFLSLGANNDIFKFESPKKKLSDKAVNLIYSGKVGVYHSVMNWIEIMKHLKAAQADIHLTIAGYGKGAALVDRKIEEYQLDNVTFLNQQFTQPELANLINRADYGLTSVDPRNKVQYEVAVPTKVFESLVCGTPIISLLGEGMNLFNDIYGFKLNQNFNLNNTSLKQIAGHLLFLKPVEVVERRRIFQRSKDFTYQWIAKQFKSILRNLLDV